MASIFRGLHAIFFSFALYKLWEIYELTSTIFIFKNLENSVKTLLVDFDLLWTIGLLFFAIHLIILGYLLLKSTNIPKIFGVLLILAAIGYLVDGIAKLSMSNYVNFKDILEMVVIAPAVVGELSFTIWLLVKGFNKKQFKIFSS